MFQGFVLALALAVAAAPAHAQQARKFGVLSLIGDSFLLVNHVRANDVPPADRRTVLYLPEHAFDNTVSADVQEAIRRAAPGAGVVKLSGDRTLYPHEGEPLDDPRPTLARVQSAVAGAGVTHLVLVTKFRRTADVPLDPKEPEEKLDGLGFYLDPAAPTGNRESPAAGYLAPFAYFRVWLVDVPRQKVIGYREIAELSPITRPRSTTAELWQSLSSTEKVQIMHSLVQEGAQRAVRELVGNLPD